MRHLPRISAMVLIAALAACSSQKEPAQAAVKAARDAYNTVDAADMRYAPQEAKTVRDALETAEQALGRAAYPLALQSATGLPDKIATLKTSIAARKQQLNSDWTKMSTMIPPVLASVTSKLKNGGGLPKDKAASAQATLAAASASWTDATVAASAGDVGTAVAKGTDVKSALTDLMTMLKMKPPAGW